MDDVKELTELNLHFIEACRKGSWEMLSQILSPSFSYLDGATGEVWDQQRYIDDLESTPLPALEIDQVAIHVDGNVGVVSSRSFITPGRYNRYIDTYERRAEGWRCVHASVWPLP